MLSYIVATIRESHEVLGYRVFTIQNGKGSMADVPLAKMCEICENGFNSFQNVEYDASKRELVGLAMKISSLPIISPQGNLKTTAGLTVTYRVVDESGKTTGFGVVDTFGLNVPITTKKLIELSSRYKNTNFDIDVDSSTGNLTVKPKGKCKFPKVAMSKIQNVKSYNSKTDSKDEVEEAKAQAEDRSKGLQLEQLEEVIQREVHKNNLSSQLASSGSENKLPGLHVYNMTDVSDSEFNIQCQDKLLLASKNLALISPYYSMMFQTIPHIPCTAIPTMGVTEDKMFYNQAFVASLPVSELTFVLIHEMLHIAMRHSVRHGNKDNELWNIATDLFINEIIQRDFGCKFGGAEVVLKVDAGNNRKVDAKIKCPSFGVFLYTIGESLDFGFDTPESIYKRLYSENKQNGGQQGNGQNNQGNNQSGQQGSSSDGQQGGSDGSQSGQQGSSGGQQMSSDGSQSGQQGSEQSTQSGSQSGQQGNSSCGSSDNGEGNESTNSNGSQNGSSDNGSEENSPNGGTNKGNESDGQSSNGNGKDGQGSGEDGKNPFEGNSCNPTGSTLDVEIIDSDNNDYTKVFKRVEVTYKGKKLQGVIPLDVVSNNENKLTAEDEERARKESSMAVQRIVTKKKIEESNNKMLSLTSGAVAVERDIRFGQSMQYNWERLLKNIANVDAKKMYTLARPNKAYMQRGITLATRQKIGKPNKISGIKFCVDTSGSVGQKELDAVFTKIEQILKHFDLDAELIYWDTSVNSVGSFEDLKGLLKIKPIGGGGTDLTCVFDYLMGKTRVNGKREETLVRDISMVMIFTDGYFGLRNKEEYEKYFSNKAVFVVNDDCPPFDPPFGKLAKRE